jgi:hypothetical protein
VIFSPAAGLSLFEGRASLGRSAGYAKPRDLAVQPPEIRSAPAASADRTVERRLACHGSDLRGREVVHHLGPCDETDKILLESLSVRLRSSARHSVYSLASESDCEG